MSADHPSPSGARSAAAAPAPPQDPPLETAPSRPPHRPRRREDGGERAGPPPTCEAEEAADALGQRQALEVGGQLNLNDTRQALQHHGGDPPAAAGGGHARRPLAPPASSARPRRACATGWNGACRARPHRSGRERRRGALQPQRAVAVATGGAMGAAERRLGGARGWGERGGGRFSRPGGSHWKT